METTMLWKTIAAGLLGFALTVPTMAEPDEEFPEGPKVEEKEDLPDSDEEDMEEEEIDVLATLESIITKMKDAEAALSHARNKVATDLEGKAIEDADKLLTSKDLQDKAIREMSKIFDGSKDNQQQAIGEIEKLIKAAKEQQGQGQQSKQQQKQKQQQQPQDPKNSKSKDPATKPYPPSANTPDSLDVERAANLGDKWGNLPDRLRDELSQADDDFRNARGNYRTRLHEYFRVIGSND